MFVLMAVFASIALLIEVQTYPLRAFLVEGWRRWRRSPQQLRHCNKLFLKNEIKKIKQTNKKKTAGVDFMHL